MSRTRFATLLRGMALVAVLVVAQTAAAVHQDADDIHPAGGICALCVGLTSLGAGNISASELLDLPPPRIELIDDLSRRPVVHRIERRFARGPPRAS